MDSGVDTWRRSLPPIATRETLWRWRFSTHHLKAWTTSSSSSSSNISDILIFSASKQGRRCRRRIWRLSSCSCVCSHWRRRSRRRRPQSICKATTVVQVPCDQDDTLPLLHHMFVWFIFIYGSVSSSIIFGISAYSMMACFFLFFCPCFCVFAFCSF